MEWLKGFFLKKISIWALVSFILPITIVGSVYYSMGIYPGSKVSILASDSFGQYSNFFASFNTMMKSDRSIFYSWSASLGLNYLSFISYYLGGLFTPFVYFFDNQNMPDFIYFLTLMKIGLIGVSFCFFSSRTFRIPKWGHMLLSVSYALMGFTIANSEVIMWMDGLMYLPLIIVGIHYLTDRNQTILLFVSYVLLFISNFYIGFMVGVYSFLYFIVWTLVERKFCMKYISRYLCTSILAGGTSMFLILPSIIDLKANGEALTSIKMLKTAATGPWDLVIKNMVGVYDTTRYGSIPFIYVGLFPIVLCLFFFFTKKIKWREKVYYGALLIVLILSFYLEGLNLFWHGFHAPNMFLFRFSFLFSFTVLLLAGYGWSKYKEKDFEKLVNIFIGMIAVFSITRVITAKNETYDYLSDTSFILTLCFLILYLLYYFLNYKKKCSGFILILFLIGVFFAELSLNTIYLVRGIHADWGYSRRSLYDENYLAVQSLVRQTEQETQHFYRLENVTAISNNESFRYGYNGLGMFSSIRNRHSSYYMNTLGFRSAGTNLSIYYQNNTLIMDALMGIKYNIADTKLSKVGFEQIAKNGENRLYKNQYALPLGILTDQRVYNKTVSSDPEQLLSVLSNVDEKFYTIIYPKIIATENVKLSSEKKYGKDVLVLTAQKKDTPIKLTWNFQIEEAAQLYLDILPASYQHLNETKVEINSNQQLSNTLLSKTGQYYSLGQYQNAQEINTEVIFTNVDRLELFEPKVVLLDTKKFIEATQKAQKKGVDFAVTGRKAIAEVTVEKEQVLFTTIAADKGWKAKIDGEKATLYPINDGLLSVIVPKGQHQIEFIYLPKGFMLGMILSICSIMIFIGYQYWLFRHIKIKPIML